MKRFLLELATGSGKTIIAAELINKIKMKTLFVVDVSILLNQTKKVFESYFDGITIGTITEGKQNWKDINVATIQTIRRLIEKKDENFLLNLEEVGVCIIDECHISKSKSYGVLINKLKSNYLIGMTGTAFVTGNGSLEIYKLFGFPEIVIKPKELINKGYLIKPEIFFIDYENKMTITEKKCHEYNEYLNKDLLNKSRLKKLKIMLKRHSKDKILLICNRIQIIEELKGELKLINHKVITGETKKDERENIIDYLKSGKINLILGSSKIVEKGLDVPELNVLVNYTNNNSDITTLQALGRILRISKGKKKCYFYDFEDLNSKNRKKILKEYGFEYTIWE